MSDDFQSLKDRRFCKCYVSKPLPWNAHWLWPQFGANALLSSTKWSRLIMELIRRMF